jgi:mRNA-degrading endonuclease toxin of MazEF toxin-antitoxin module
MNRGDVVEVDWPFTDLTGTKPRPAVVVQADFLNGLIDDTIYVKIQGNAYGIPGTEVEIDPAVETFSGLSKVCYASCRDILTRPIAHPSHCGRAVRCGFAADRRLLEEGSGDPVTSRPWEIGS